LAFFGVSKSPGRGDDVRRQSSRRRDRVILLGGLLVYVVVVVEGRGEGDGGKAVFVDSCSLQRERVVGVRESGLRCGGSDRDGGDGKRERERRGVVREVLGHGARRGRDGRRGTVNRKVSACEEYMGRGRCSHGLSEVRKHRLRCCC
jgi:hypothetical protein